MKQGRRIGIGLLLSGALSLAVAAAPWIGSSATAPHAYYTGHALRTQAYTWQHLAYAGGASDCPSAPYPTYRRTGLDPGIADHWYVALQVRADAALVDLGEPAFRCHVEKAYP